MSKAKKEPKKIKSFIYLDDYKMYSISSQVFEGLTEYVINHSKNSNQEFESQEGPVGSGRVLADIISQEASSMERKLLYDYSYNIFEEKLIQDKRTIIIDQSNIDEGLRLLDNYAFIKISGKLLFNDINTINRTIKSFNEIGEAFAYVTNYQALASLKDQYESVLSQTRDKNQKNLLKKQFEEESTNLLELAKKSGLNFDQKFLDKIAFLLEYGYSSQFEVRTSLTDKDRQVRIFSAILKREFLREDETLLIKKYSRSSEKDFVIFGMITQSGEQSAAETLSQQVSEQPASMKEAVVQLALHLLGVENQFTGKLSNEVVIDPIAIYREF